MPLIPIYGILFIKELGYKVLAECPYKQGALLRYRATRRVSKILPTAAQQCIETTCTTSPEQIEVMELEGYSRPTYNKLCAFSHDALVGVIHKLGRRRVFLTTSIHHRTHRVASEN